MLHARPVSYLSWCSAAALALGRLPAAVKPGSAQRWWRYPLKSSMPTMPKMSSTKPHSISTLPILGTTSSTHCTSTGIPGTRFNARSGRSARKARSPEKLPICARARAGAARERRRRRARAHEPRGVRCARAGARSPGVRGHAGMRAPTWGKRMGSHASVTMTKSSWHHGSRR